MEIILCLVVTTEIQTVLKDWFRSMSPIAQACFTIGNWELLWTFNPDLASHCWEDRPVIIPDWFHFQDSCSLCFLYCFDFHFQVLKSFTCFNYLAFIFFTLFWECVLQLFMFSLIFWLFIDFLQHLCFLEFKWFIYFLFKDLCYLHIIVFKVFCISAMLEYSVPAMIG